ncbi:MAG: hypothetical protein RLY58_458, partial [Pseudomonadota bacterium]
MSKFSSYLINSVFLLATSLTYAAPTPNGDAVSQSYVASESLQTQEHVPGISLLGGQITHNQPVISGRLPYVMSYVGSVRNSISASNDYFDQFLTTGGWTDNYQNSIRFIKSNADVNNTNIGYYIVRLPGSTRDIWLRNTDALCPLTRGYSSDALGYIVYKNAANMAWSCDTRGYKITTNSGGGVTINYRGTAYTSTTTSINQSGMYYYRIAKVTQPQGKELTFGYDSGMNMLSVADNLNNKIIFTRTYKVGATQTAAEKRLINKISLTSGTGTSQISTITYDSYNSQDANGSQGSIYYPTSVTSTANGKTTFGYTPIQQWGIEGYLIYTGKTIVNTKAAILTSIKNSANAIIREWLVTQNYANYDSSTKNYGTAQVTLQVRSPVGLSYAQDYTVDYNDNARTVHLTNRAISNAEANYLLSAKAVAYVYGGTTYYDDSELSIVASGRLSPPEFSVLTIDNNIPTGFVLDIWRDYIKSAQTANGLLIEQKIDTEGRLITKNLTAEKTVKEFTYSYDALSTGAVNPFIIPTKVVTPYQTIINVVNEKGQITSQTQGSAQTGSSSKTIAYTYNAQGLPFTIDGPLAGQGDVVTYTYDSYGNKASESQVVNGVTRSTQYLAYNSLAQPERIVYPNGLVDQFFYNTDGTLQKTVHGTGGTTGDISGQTISYTYDSLKRVKTETSPDGEVTGYEYDSLGRVIKITLPTGGVTNKTYYSNNVVSAEETKDATGTILVGNYQTLDDSGRVYSRRVGDNSVQYYTYDLNNNLKEMRTGLGIFEYWTFDGFNRMRSHTNGNGEVETRSYDLQDNVISAKDAINAGSNPIEYINGGVLKKETNADFDTKTYGYDASDRLVQSVHNSRQCNYINIDVLGRPSNGWCTQNNTSTVNNALIHDYSYLYDNSRFGVLDAANSVNNLFGTDTSYTYDDYNRILSKTQNTRAITQWGGTQPIRTVSYTYSTGGKITSMTLPSGRQVSYVYTPQTGQLSSVQLNGSNLINIVKHNGAGQTLSWIWGNDSAYNIAYDFSKNGSIKTITNTDSENVQNYKADYDFNNDGMILSIAGLNTKDSYTYDKVSRLLTENRLNVRTSTAVFGATYTYDRNGNRLSLAATGAHQQPAANVSYTHKANSNRLATLTREGVVTTPSHLTEGELQLDFAGVYDAAGQRRWSGRRNGDTTLPQYYMAYNHKRERTVRSIQNNGASWNSNAIQYVYDEASHLIGEYKSNGTPLVEYVWKGDVPIAAIYGTTSATKIYYIVTDAQNTPRRLIDSSNNAVVWAWDSTAFGVAPPSIETVKFNLRFPGQYYDAITKQHYNLNRYYNPEIGRYMEADPIGLEGGLNPYAYAGSNPVMNVDANGLKIIFAPSASKEFISDFQRVRDKAKKLGFGMWFDYLDQNTQNIMVQPSNNTMSAVDNNGNIKWDSR